MHSFHDERTNRHNSFDDLFGEIVPYFTDPSKFQVAYPPARPTHQPQTGLDINFICFLPCRGKINLTSTIFWLPELFTIRTKTPKQTNNKVKQLSTLLCLFWKFIYILTHCGNLPKIIAFIWQSLIVIFWITV